MEALLELLLETEMVIRELTFAVWNAAWLESMLQHHLGDTELSMMMRLHWLICMSFMTTRTKSSGQSIHWKLRYLKIG